MIKIKSPVFYVDVDDTLVIWGLRGHPEAVEFVNFGFKEMLVPHKRHIEMIKQAKFRGQSVVVWSQGGEDWAEEVVKKLGLEEYVDLVISKPDWYIDDLPSSAFMGESNRIYLEDYKPKKGSWADEEQKGGQKPQGSQDE